MDELDETKFRWEKIYGHLFSNKKYEPKRKDVKLTKHAEYRISERLNLYGYTAETIRNDIKKWWTNFRYVGNGCYRIRCWLGKYIINKDFIVITFWPNADIAPINKHPKENQAGEEGESRA